MKKLEECDCDVIHEETIGKILNNMLEEEQFDKLSDFFKILGDKTRIKILFCIDQNEMCVCDIANTLGMTKSAISHQLATLKQMGIVKNRRDGKEVFYSLYDEHVREVFEVGLEHINHKLEGEI